uniref:Uncharacterized protein n=1 Tax=Oryza punctata TaxID=4537 RepID=A0A0E0MKC2_ORYPU
MAHFTTASSSPLYTGGLEGGRELAVAAAAAVVTASTRRYWTELLVQAKTVDQSKSETDADAPQRGLQDLNEKLQNLEKLFFLRERLDSQTPKHWEQEEEERAMAKNTESPKT